MMKEEIKKINSKIWGAINKNLEFKLLRDVHKYYFEKPITKDYLNYALDTFNSYKAYDSTVKNSKYLAIKSTIRKIKVDYLLLKDVLGVMK